MSAPAMDLTLATPQKRKRSSGQAAKVAKAIKQSADDMAADRQEQDILMICNTLRAHPHLILPVIATIQGGSLAEQPAKDDLFPRG